MNLLLLPAAKYFPSEEKFSDVIYSPSAIKSENFFKTFKVLKSQIKN